MFEPPPWGAGVGPCRDLEMPLWARVPFARSKFTPFPACFTPGCRDGDLVASGCIPMLSSRIFTWVSRLQTKFDFLGCLQVFQPSFFLFPPPRHCEVAGKAVRPSLLSGHPRVKLQDCGLKFDLLFIYFFLPAVILAYQFPGWACSLRFSHFIFTCSSTYFQILSPSNFFLKLFWKALTVNVSPRSAPLY